MRKKKTIRRFFLLLAHATMNTISDQSQASVSSTGTGTTAQTYEAAKALRFTANQPDKIHWNSAVSFREEPYRFLHHQDGCIGVFTIRLLEASDLIRSYWSPLALGPVKLLGLSKAHGDVSSYCTFSVGYHEKARPTFNIVNANSTCKAAASSAFSDGDSKPPAQNMNNHYNQQQVMMSGECKSSPVVECNNNPVWDNCILEFPLRKGAAPADGMGVHLNLRVDEDSTAVENLIPGILPGKREDRVLGFGQLDLTEILFGETSDGQPVPSVRDEWIPIYLQHHHSRVDNSQYRELEQQLMYSSNDPLAPPSTNTGPRTSVISNRDHDTTTNLTGLVRVLVSYQPHGMEPKPKDVVAMECFARRNLSISSCRPLLEPLHPLVVIDRRGPYLLCEYTLPASIVGNTKKPKATVRLHRNTVFVVERQSIIDAAHNLALLPIDVALSTPLGRAAQNALAPAISAGSELFMPAVLSFKLIMMASRATAVASLSGVNALTSTLVRESASGLLQKHKNQSHQQYQQQPASNLNMDNRLRRDDSRLGTAQYVQL